MATHGRQAMKRLAHSRAVSQATNQSLAADYRVVRALLREALGFIRTDSEKPWLPLKRQMLLRLIEDALKSSNPGADLKGRTVEIMGEDNG